MFRLRVLRLVFLVIGSQVVHFARVCFRLPREDFSILNSKRPCLQGPHAATFHGVVGLPTGPREVGVAFVVTRAADMSFASCMLTRAASMFVCKSLSVF